MSQKSYKILILKILFIGLSDLISAYALILKGCIGSHQDTPVHGNQMRRKAHHHILTCCIGKLLLNLGSMPVIGHAVSLYALVHLAEQIRSLGRASCS